MEDKQPVEEISTRQRFPWGELVLYIFGGFGVFSLASIGAGYLSQFIGQWSIAVVVLTNAAFIGGSVWYLGVLRGKTSWKEIGFFPTRWNWSWVLVAIGLSVALMPIRGLIGLLVSYLVEGGMQSLQNRADLLLGGAMDFSWLGFALTFVGVGLIVPISEELYFRGLLHRLFQPYLKLWPRVLLSSAFFALGHFDSIGVVFSSYVMGVVIALAYERTKSLWMAIAIHMATNSIAVLLLYLWLLLHNTFFSNIPLQF